ncbi:hypothetical protein HU200_052352 [Digitaria exilis]|uniref:Transcription repressor n=1 Tax=Digitaria exilis TaxID=1010633 RepID=A0A835E4A7_9POAL|nr:hypothetical protein HU200_052352 [Digitaria exilis]CAB3479621.1 unnamed protein product [Digitaria exilis]
MVKKQQFVGGLTSLFSSNNKQLDTRGAVLPGHSSSSSMSSSSFSVWQWTSCGLHPRTISFREELEEEADGYGSQLHDNDNDRHMVAMKQPAYYKTMSSVDDSSMPTSDAEAEAVISALRSDRLFFEPEDTSSFKQPMTKQAVDEDEDMAMSSKSAAATEAFFGGGMATSVESRNPYRDFRESMEEMVMSQAQGGVNKDWRWLEEMLGWYLRANGKSTHGFIVGAFVDLLVALSASSPADLSSSPTTPAAANCSSSSECSCSSSSSSL